MSNFAELAKEALKSERVAMFAMSAIVHLKEYIDTDEPMDLAAANGIISGVEMRGWIDENKIMLPLRRDGKSIYE